MIDTDRGTNEYFGDEDELDIEIELEEDYESINDYVKIDKELFDE
jgi:hypothetical protein